MTSGQILLNYIYILQIRLDMNPVVTLFCALSLKLSSYEPEKLQLDVTAR